MSNRKNEDLKLNVISKIDPEIIDEVTNKRIKYINAMGKGNKKKLTAIIAIAAALAVLLSVMAVIIIPLLKPSGSVPIYTGMTVSAPGGESLALGLKPLSANGQGFGMMLLDNSNTEGNNGNHGANNPNKKPVEDIINDSGTLAPIPSEQMYYAKQNEDIIITIHFENPDEYKIMSFKLNGKAYADYMFEYGSDYENIMIKVNVGEALGIVDYTIDAIQYADRDVLKYVEMKGDPTLSIGVYNEAQPTPSVTNEKTGINSFEFDVDIPGVNTLAALSGGKLYAIVADDTEIVKLQELKVGQTSVKFDGLKTGTAYRYAIIAEYDAQDGEGYKSYILTEKEFTTDEVITLENLNVGTNEISFDLVWNEAFASSKPMTSFELYKNGEKIRDIDFGAVKISELLSNTEYTIIIEYSNNGNKETEKFNFKTLEKAVPTIEINSTNVTQTSIEFEIKETDTYNVGEIVKIELVKGENVTVAENIGVREFNGLLSDNDYTIKVSCKYDLNDGNGEQELVKNANFKTKAKKAPTVSIVNVEKTKDSVSFGITNTDIDSILNITSIKIGDGNGTVKEFSVADSAFSLNSLVPNTEYKIFVEYEYDLNDGNGIQKKTVNNTVYTDPIVTVISSKCINTTAISKGDTIVLRITTEDIGNAKITSAKVNGAVYSISPLSSAVNTVVEIVYSDQFEGGDTELVLEQLTVFAYGESYTLDINSNNKTSCFVYGDFDVESIALTDETGKPVEYLMPSDQAYYYIKLQNSTGYEVVGVELLNMIYTQYVEFGKDSIKMLDNDTLMIPFDHTVRSGGYGEKYYRLKSVTFINASGEEETRIVETVPNNNIYYVVLEKDGIVEISKPEDLKNMGTAAYYKLMCDIDLSALSWDAPGEFRGYFDGNGHTISGMTVVKTYTDQSATLGLFSYADGIIKDLNIKDTFIIVTVKNERLYYGCIAGRGTPILRNVTVSGSSQFTASVYGLAQYINDGNVNIGETILVNQNQFKYSAMKPLAYGYNHFNNWNLTTDAEKYQVTYSFEVNGGEPIADRLSVYLGNIIPKKDLHMFLGWYDNAEFEGEPLSPSYRTGKNVRVYAKWVYTGINENQGLEMSEDGYITGIGTCTDKVLVLNAPISSFAFENCKTIEKVYLGPKVTGIGDNAFMGCTGLKEVVMADGIEAVFSAAFRGCTSLEKINLPDTIVEFHSYELFYGCENLKEIVLPNGITEIGERAFKGCTSLESIKIPSTVKTIREGAFTQSGLKEISLPEGITEIAQGVFEGCSYLEKIDLPDSLVNIETCAFQNCSKLKEIKLGNKLVSIGGHAFSGCSSLESINIPDTVTKIEARAFRDCPQIASINIPDGVTRIEDGTFSGCAGLTAINIPLGVTSIGANAFYGCSGLKEITVPGNVTQIGARAFYMCMSLKKVVLSEGLEKIGESAFGDCSFENFTIPSTVKEIGAGAFQSCEVLTAIILPDGITRIEPETFKYCVALESVFIPQSVTFIGDSAFYECRALESIELHDALRSIGVAAFYGCESLTTITLPRNVTRIEHNTFTDCYNLKEVLIEGDLTFIGEQAFWFCQALESIIIPQTVITIEQSAFGNNGMINIFVEAESKPDGWHTQWNPHSHTVIWGYKEQ